MRPLLLDRDLAPLKLISEAGFRHTASQDIVTVVRHPNGEYVETTIAGPDQLCRLMNAGSRLTDKAAALGVKAQWSLVFELGTPVSPGETYMIRGTTAGVDWQRWVEITADLGLTGRIHRQTTAIDLELNQ